MQPFAANDAHWAEPTRLFAASTAAVPLAATARTQLSKHAEAKPWSTQSASPVHAALASNAACTSLRAEAASASHELGVEDDAEPVPGEVEPPHAIRARATTSPANGADSTERRYQHRSPDVTERELRCTR